MGRKISTPITIAIAVAGVVLVWAAINWQLGLFPQNQNWFWPVRSQVSAQEKACLASGGTPGTALCCQSVGDFPNTCLIGACGCAPNYSHQVKTCDCSEEKCFNGKKCIGLEKE